MEKIELSPDQLKETERLLDIKNNKRFDDIETKEINERGFEGSGNEFIDAKIEPIKYIVEDLISEEGLFYVFGPPESFKSYFLLDVCLKCTRGEMVLGKLHTKKCRTLYIDEENRMRRMYTRIKALANGMNMTKEELDDFRCITEKSFVICNDKWYRWLEEKIEEFKPELVIIDGVSKVFIGNQKEDKDVSDIYRWFAPLINKYKCSFGLLTHTTKMNNKKFGSLRMDDLYGNRQFSAMADSVFGFNKVNNNEFMIKQVKHKDAEHMTSENFSILPVEDEDGELKSMKVIYTGTSKDRYEKNKTNKADKIKDDILEWIKNNKIKKFKRKLCLNAMEELGHKRDNIDNALKMLKEEGFTCKSGLYEISS